MDPPANATPSAANARSPMTTPMRPARLVMASGYLSISLQGADLAQKVT
jgi:hypothetical protein